MIGTEAASKGFFERFCENETVADVKLTVILLASVYSMDQEKHLRL